MKSKAMIPLILGLAVGIATVKLAVDTIKKAQAGNQPTETVKAVRAIQDIGSHKKITPEMVELVETTESPFAPANDRLESLEEIVGRVTAKPIPRYGAVLKSMLAPEGSSPGMVGRIPLGYRAVSVRIDEVTGVAFQISPGDWVDVIVVMDIKNSVRGGRETIAEVILQHVQVAAIGYAGNTGAKAGMGKIKPARSVTLLIREADAPKLHLAATHGKITLTMRGDEDETTGDPASANLSDVVAALRSRDEASKRADAEVEKATRPDRRGTEPPRMLPHDVVVYHGVTGDQAATRVERITFEHGQSSKIVGVTFGPPTRSAAVMRESARATRGGGGQREEADSTEPDDDS